MIGAHDSTASQVSSGARCQRPVQRFRTEIRPLGVDVSLAFRAGGGAQDRCPAGRDWDEARPQRVLPLIIDEDMETTIGIVKNTGHSRPPISAAAVIDNDRHCQPSAMSYRHAAYIHTFTKSSAYLCCFSGDINI